MCFVGRGFEEGINKSPEPGASEQLEWAGKKEVPPSTGTTGGGNAHLSPSCVLVRNCFNCFLFFLQNEDIVVTTLVQICLLSLNINQRINYALNSHA